MKKKTVSNVSKEDKKASKKLEKQLELERLNNYKRLMEQEKSRQTESLEAPKDPDTILSLKHVNKIYTNGYVQAVYDFNLDINKNDFVVLVGPSGCGKSTTLRMIAGLEEITAGDLFINGNYSNNVQPKDRDMAMVFQSYALYPHLTVYGNMSFSLKLRHFSKEEINERVKNAAMILELENYLDRKPKELSGGQRQRVALGRAIVRNANIFLMDEPLSNLDAKLRVQMRSEIVKLHNRLNATTIYVTHDQTEAMSMATKLVVMKLGRVQQIGTPNDIYYHPHNTFVATFIGSPAMNLIDSSLVKNKVAVGPVSVSLTKEELNKISSFYKDYENQLLEEIEIEKKNLIDDINNNKKIKDKEEAIATLFSHHLQELRDKFDELKEFMGKEEKKIIVGVRPESLYINNKDCDYHFKMTITVSEMLGKEFYLHFDVNNKDLIAKAESKEVFHQKQEVALCFNKEDLYFFDPLTTNRII